MFEEVLKVGPFLAGMAALIALIVSATATARLRRQEELLREAAESTDPPHRDALTDRHRWVLSRILARQVCGRWRFTWPWLAWVSLAAFTIPPTYILAERLSRSEPTPPSEVLAIFAGDTGTHAVFLLAVFPFLLIPVFTSLEWSLRQRASIARQFYETGVLHRPERWREWANLPRGSTRWKTVGKNLLALVPGLAALSFGLFLGVAAFDRRHPEVIHQGHPGLMNLNGWAVFAMGFSIALTMLVVSFVRFDLETALNDPLTHPPSPLILPNRER